MYLTYEDGSRAMKFAGAWLNEGVASAFHRSGSGALQGRLPSQLQMKEWQR